MRYLICLLLLAGSIAWTGCAPATLEGTIAASGTVTYNGQAVEGANVVFSPEGRAARDRLDGRQRPFSVADAHAGGRRDARQIPGRDLQDAGGRRP